MRIEQADCPPLIIAIVELVPGQTACVPLHSDDVSTLLAKVGAMLSPSKDLSHTQSSWSSFLQSRLLMNTSLCVTAFNQGGPAVFTGPGVGGAASAVTAPFEALFQFNTTGKYYFNDALDPEFTVGIITVQAPRKCLLLGVFNSLPDIVY
jgi:hypothetical protein